MWKNLKSYFIVEEEASSKPTKSSIPDKRQNPQPSSVGPPTSPGAPDQQAIRKEGRVEDKFVAVLLQAMEKANLPGFDYLEYKKSLKNLEKMNFDDAIRFQTAYAAAQSMGVTPQQLIDSAHHYLDTLNGEQEKFSLALANQQEDQISKKENDLKTLDASIQEQEAKIKALQDQIAQTRKRQDKLRSTIKDNKDRISATAADFKKTYQTIAGSIQDDINKMKEYLK